MKELKICISNTLMIDLERMAVLCQTTPDHMIDRAIEGYLQDLEILCDGSYPADWDWERLVEMPVNLKGVAERFADRVDALHRKLQKTRVLPV